ncbi:MAG: hypothetical protein FJX53_09320 [Alphaproteobacteria bacterium]|nr:hypothetical protein [Alphaproteobacteria bacterium]
MRRTAGGAIGGAPAAVASGMAALGVSIDVGGGNRAAPSFCGVIGLRPTAGLIPNWPSPMPWDLLATVAPVARDAADTAMLLGAMAGATRTSPVASGRPAEDYLDAVTGFSIEGLRVAWLADPARVGVTPAIGQACRRAADTLAAAGADLAELRLDLSAARDTFRVLHANWPSRASPTCWTVSTISGRCWHRWCGVPGADTGRAGPRGGPAGGVVGAADRDAVAVRPVADPDRAGRPVRGRRDGPGRRQRAGWLIGPPGMARHLQLGVAARAAGGDGAGRAR